MQVGDTVTQVGDTVTLNGVPHLVIGRVHDSVTLVPVDDEQGAADATYRELTDDEQAAEDRTWD